MSKTSKIILILIGVGLLALIISSSLAPKEEEYEIWTQAMTLGDPETAEHHFIMYTDIFCPYCDKFSNAIEANIDDFKKDYIEDKKILFEVRVTDMNYESGHSNNSRPAAIGAYCAARQDKFWDYYYMTLLHLWNDYHSQGIGISASSERIPDLGNDWFKARAEDGGLDMESFNACLDNEETADEVDKFTIKAQRKRISGIPHFTFDKTSYSGFDGNWDIDHDYRQAKLMMDAALSK